MEFESKKELLYAFHSVAMPSERCMCKEDVPYWLASQRFYLSRTLKGLPHEDLHVRASMDESQQKLYMVDPEDKDDSFACFKARFKQEI